METNLLFKKTSSKSDSSWFTYIVRCGDGSLYTGITNDLKKRIKAHNEGKGAKYTKGRGPIKLLIYFKFENKSLAAKEEYRIKKLSKTQKEILINESSGLRP